MKHRDICTRQVWSCYTSKLKQKHDLIGLLALMTGCNNKYAMQVNALNTSLLTASRVTWGVARRSRTASL